MLGEPTLFTFISQMLAHDAEGGYQAPEQTLGFRCVVAISAQFGHELLLPGNALFALAQMPLCLGEVILLLPLHAALTVSERANIHQFIVLVPQTDEGELSE